MLDRQGSVLELGCASGYPVFEEARKLGLLALGRHLTPILLLRFLTAT